MHNNQNTILVSLAPMLVYEEQMKMQQEFDQRKGSDKGKKVVSMEDKTMVDNKEKMRKNCYAKQASVLTHPLLTCFVALVADLRSNPIKVKGNDVSMSKPTRACFEPGPRKLYKSNQLVKDVQSKAISQLCIKYVNFI